MLWMIVMPLMFSAFTGYQGWEHGEYLRNFSSTQWVGVYLASVFTMALAFTPTTFVATLSGVFLGWQSLWYLVPAYLLASVIGFGLSKKVGATSIQTVLHAYPASDRILHRLRQSDLLLTVMCRISPVLPFAIMNIVLGYAGVRFWSFLLGGLIGMLPRTAMAVALGMQLQALTEGSLLAVLWLILLAVSIVGLGLVFRNSLK